MNIPSFAQYILEKEKGLFVAAKFLGLKESYDKFIKENNIQNPVPYDELHCTVIYSTKFVDFNIQNYVPGDNFSVPFEDFHVFDTQDETKALVLKLGGNTFQKIHDKIMKENDLVYDYDEYIPHMTISYDWEGDVESLSEPKFEIEFGDFYQEDIK